MRRAEENPLKPAPPRWCTADRRRRRHVERLLAARLCDAQRHRRARRQLGRHALPFVTHHPGAGPRKRRTVQPFALVRAGHQQRHLQRREIARRQPLDQPQPEMRAHAGAQHLGRPQQRRAFQRHDLRETKRRRAAQDGADVARVLHTVEHHRGRFGLQRGRRRQIKHESQRCGRRQIADAGHQRIIDDYIFNSCLRKSGRRQRPKRR